MKIDNQICYYMVVNYNNGMKIYYYVFTTLFTNYLHNITTSTICVEFITQFQVTVMLTIYLIVYFNT